MIDITKIVFFGLKSINKLELTYQMVKYCQVYFVGLLIIMKLFSCINF